MHKTLPVFILTLILLMLGGCATAPVSDIKVKAEVAPGYTPSEYKTYAWLATAQIINDPEGNWEPPQFDADAEIKWLIDREMRARGISEVAAYPNVFIAFVAGVDMKHLQLEKDPRMDIDVLQNAPKGALVVILIDGATGNPVWAAAAVGDVDTNRTPEDTKARLDYAVRQMFKKLPRSKVTNTDSSYY